MLVFTIKIRLGRVSVVIAYIEQWRRIMEQLEFSMGLVTPLILYGRVIFSRCSRALLWSVFIEHKYQVLLLSWCLSTPNYVSPNVMLLIQ